MLRTVLATFSAFAMLLTCLPAGAACSRPMHLIPEQWPPYIIVDEKGTRGLDIELVEAIFKEAGCTLVYEARLPVARRNVMFELGKTDMLIAASSTPERRQRALLSLPYREEEVGVFTLPENAARLRTAFSMQALLDRHEAVLAPQSGWYGEQYAEVAPKLRAAGLLSEYTQYQQALKMLAAGRATVLLGEDVSVHYEARLQNLPLVHLPFVASRSPVHLMFNKERVTTADLAQINAAITRLERNGSLNAIRRRYGQQ